jgi:hypothetical protein
MASLKRQIIDSEKQQVLAQQRRGGALYCFVDDHPIESDGDVEFHHIKPFSEGDYQHWSSLQGPPSPHPYAVAF